MSIGANLEKLFSLESKVVLFTGAAGGIGSELAAGLAEAGASLALCDIDKPKLDEIKARIESEGGKATAHILNVTDKNNIKSCVEEIGNHYGHVDVLVNCAGINKREGFLDVEEETYDRIMDINLKGVFLVSREVAPNMMRQKSVQLPEIL